MIYTPRNNHVTHLYPRRVHSSINIGINATTCAMFFDEEDDEETQRKRKLIAADYTDSDDAYEEEEVDNVERDGDYESGGDNDDDYDDDDDAVLDPSLRAASSSTRRPRGVEDFSEDEDVDEDEDGENLHDNLRLAAGFRVPAALRRVIGATKSGKRRGKAVIREQEPSDEVKILLGQANQAYATNDLDEAERILAEVIRIDNHVYAAWKTLGEIHKQRGDIPKCLLAWISAGHLRLKDSELWSICGKLSFQIGQVDQALYCYNRAILANGQDVEAIFERGLVFKKMGNLSKALEAFKKIHDMLPEDLTVIKELASIHVLQHNMTSATKLYEDILAASQAPARAAQPSSRSKRGSKAAASSSSMSAPEFGWSELNILAELYGAQKEWLKAIKFIKSTARWLLQRQNERFWNDVPDDNDDEYDKDKAQLNRHFPITKKDDDDALAAYTLPLDLRAKMVIYRLKLGHIPAAIDHAAYLLAEAEREDATKEDKRHYADLFLDVADALMDAEQYELALSLYMPLVEMEEDYATPQLVMSMGRCLHGLGDFLQAETAYRTVMANDKNSLDARIALAEVYEATGKRHEALELVNEVMRLRRQQERAKAAAAAAAAAGDRGHGSGLIEPEIVLRAAVNGRMNMDVDQQDETANDEMVSFFIANTDGHTKSNVGRPRNPANASQQRVRPTRAERIRAEELASEIVAAKLRRLRQYQDGLRKGNPVAVAEWLQAASELVDMFTNTKAFFPSDKYRLFRGFSVTAKRREKKLNLNDRLRGMATRLQENFDDDEDDEEAAREAESFKNATEFRGLSFDGWFTIFMQYALSLTWHEEVEDAYSVLRRAKDANVFVQDKERVRIMDLVHFSCAIHSEDYRTSMELVRGLILRQETMFSPMMYKLFLASVPSGVRAQDMFNLAGTQKYLLRQVKGLDSVVQGRAIEGSLKVAAHATSSGTSETLRKEALPMLLTLYGQILAASRSHVPSLSYYMRSFEIVPRDPMVLFSIGLAHLHRAMQRQTNNRHLQIVQGLSYLTEYGRVRVETALSLFDNNRRAVWAEEQEVNYNIGRAFHMLGLLTLAANYYEMVLQIEPVTDNEVEGDAECKEVASRDYDLRMEAAYNLQLVYMMSGNSRLARMVVDKYLVV
ncbi:uncharacterized protein V1518DRAFT_418503 [Limtongia smithiae]|uniref:uncharacterized protein n=1 Tax=Limtongia smithiae TaxID=1125753 RepID=UPI0034CE5E46